MTAFSHKLDQVTYPRMERQDLTQAQLGSFKFTPTDEVRSMLPETSPRLAKQFMRSLATDSRSFRPALKLSTAMQGNEYTTHTSPGVTTSPPRFNSALFDTHFKPDLANSRLRLGPTALRAAIDGCPTSPRKQQSGFNHYHQALNENTMHSNVSMIGLKVVPSADKLRQIPTQKGDEFYYTSAHGAVPLAVNSTSTPSIQQDVTFFQASLLQALATEQHAHQATKIALEIERDRRINAEAETQKYLEHNRSLLGSVNMLKSVIQHNMKREQATVENTEHKRFHEEPVPLSQPRTILFDALKHLRNPNTAPVASQTADESHFFHFDKVDSTGLPAFRRQFSTSIKETSPEGIEASAETAQLISISPEKTTRHKKFDESWDSEETAGSANCDENAFRKVSAVLTTKSGNIPEASGSNKAQLMTMPFDAHIQWNQVTIFDDQDDKRQRIGAQPSIFAQHPIRYLPNKSNKNLYRTVMIDFVPYDTTYKEVLQNIRGGAVESIQLYGPVGRSTNFITARVVFNYEMGARSVYLRGQNPGIWIQEKRVRVWQVLEATYPRTKELEKEIFDDGYTRVMLIENVSELSVQKLPQKLAHQMQAGFVVEIGKSYDNIPMIEFTSIAECSKALEKLIKDRDFAGSRFDFDEDPCSDAY